MSSREQELRRELKRRLDEFRELPFPPDSAEDERLGELHAELADYDGYVVGLASSAADHVDVDADRLEPNADLRGALEAFARSANEADRMTAQAHLNYLSGIELVAASARDLLRSTRSNP